MSFKASLVKTAIKLTPNKMIVWVANFVLKDIAELTDFNFDIDTRQLYVQVQLLGESETIDVWMDDFAIVQDGESYEFIIKQTKSNRLWLDNLLKKIAGRAWKIPAMPQFAAYIDLMAEVFKVENTVEPEAEKIEEPAQEVVED